MVNDRLLLILMIGMSLVSGCLPKREMAGRHASERPAPVFRTEGGAPILTDASDASPRASVHGHRRGRSLLESYAEVLGVPAKELRTPQLYEFIDQWMGTPHGSGATRRTGIDCSAFVGLLMQEVYRKQVPRTSAEMGEIVKRKYERQLTEGDLVFFSFGNNGRIDHVGVYLTNGKFVHVSTRRGVIISRLRDSWYYRYFTRCGSVSR